MLAVRPSHCAVVPFACSAFFFCKYSSRLFSVVCYCVGRQRDAEAPPGARHKRGGSVYGVDTVSVVLFPLRRDPVHGEPG